MLLLRLISVLYFVVKYILHVPFIFNLKNIFLLYLGLVWLVQESIVRVKNLHLLLIPLVSRQSLRISFRNKRCLLVLSQYRIFQNFNSFLKFISFDGVYLGVWLAHELFKFLNITVWSFFQDFFHSVLNEKAFHASDILIVLLALVLLAFLLLFVIFHIHIYSCY